MKSGLLSDAQIKKINSKINKIFSTNNLDYAYYENTKIWEAKIKINELKIAKRSIFSFIKKLKEIIVIFINYYYSIEKQLLLQKWAKKEDIENVKIKIKNLKKFIAELLYIFPSLLNSISCEFNEKIEMFEILDEFKKQWINSIIDNIMWNEDKTYLNAIYDYFIFFGIDNNKELAKIDEITLYFHFDIKNDFLIKELKEKKFIYIKLQNYNNYFEKLFYKYNNKEDILETEKVLIN